MENSGHWNKKRGRILTWLGIAAVLLLVGTERLSAAEERLPVSVAFQPYSATNSSSDPGTFFLRGILTVEYDLGALGSRIDPEVLQPGRYDGARAVTLVEEAGLPPVSVVNDTLTEFAGTVLFVGREGRVLLTRDVLSHLHPPTTFNAFPLDRHTLPVVFTVFGSRAGEIDLQERGRVFLDPQFHKESSKRGGDYFIESLPSMASRETVAGIGSLPAVTFTYELSRPLLYYLTASFLPQLIALGLVFTVPWVKGLQFMDATKLTATVLLSVFANMLVMDNNVPSGDYLTVLDAFYLTLVILGGAIILAQLLFVKEGTAGSERRRQVVARVSLCVYGGAWLTMALGVMFHYLE